MIKALRDCQQAELASFAVTIVGGGAAGISLAIALSRKGQRVLLIEGGDWKCPADNDAYVGEVQAPHPPTTDFRYQRLGGTTHLWGGRCVPLDRIDLTPRPHISRSGWPLSFEELSAYYPEALNYCDAGDADFTVQSLQMPAPMFRELAAMHDTLDEWIERYSLPTDFAHKFGTELRQSAQILVVKQSRVTMLHLNTEGSRVSSIEVSDGTSGLTVNVNQLIICGGGIESTRLLLATRRMHAAWQRFDDSLGKYYACHYDLIFGALRFDGEKPRFSFEKTRDGVYARRKLQFNEATLNQHTLLNSTFRLHFPAYADPAHGSGVLSTIYLAKSILAREYQAILNHGQQEGASHNQYAAHLKNLVTDLPAVAGFGLDWLFKRKLARRKLPYTLINNRNGTYPLEFNSEQVPDPRNQIRLLEPADKFGMPRVQVDWQLTGQDIDSGIRSFKLMQQLLATTKNCRLEFDARALEESVQAAPPVGGHHIGATRMGDSPANSVVDKHCQVHGVDNLFVSSSSVFPSNGHANPTLTIVALSLRLADHLHKNSRI